MRLRLAILALGIMWFVPHPAVAATLGLSPSTISRSVGDTFSVDAYVSSAGQSTNAVSGVISFPQDKLQVMSVSKVGSVMNLWVQDPSFSNSQGTINFEGVALNPGYTGGHGTLVTIVFRARAVGQADVSFASAAVLANDGLGTNILESAGRANFAIVSDAVIAVPEPVIEEALGVGAPVIVSDTHPGQSKWYADNTPQFSWDLPPNALEVRTIISSSAKAIPTVRYAKPISKKSVEALPDGTYYFALQIRTSEGWGPVARYRINIDTTAPRPFAVTFPHGTRGFEPQPVLLFNTTDSGSGVSRYDVKVEGSGPVRIEPSAVSNPYPLTPQYPGTRTVVVTAVDEAGNTRSASADFTIESIDAPVITYYQEEIESGDIVKIRGTTYPNSEIAVLIKQDEKVMAEEYTKSNSTGDFAVVATKRLTAGAYTFTARVTDARGARSNESTPLNLIVNSAFLTELTDLLLNYLSAAILILTALGSVIGVATFLWYRLSKVVRRLRKEAREAEQMLKKSFALLRKDIDGHVAVLRSVKTKRRLTAEELDFLERFSRDLSESEGILTKEIQDVSHS